MLVVLTPESDVFAAYSQMMRAKRVRARRARQPPSIDKYGAREQLTEKLTDS